MNQINQEIQALLKSYQGNISQILMDENNLEYLYALSDQRELLLEWYDFKPEASLLQLGADYGAMTGLFCEMVQEVTVLDADCEMLETVQLRHGTKQNLSLVQNTLLGHAQTCNCSYDYITIIGSLDTQYETQIELAKTLLKKDGVLILSVANSLGLKYIIGAKQREETLSKNKITALFEDKGGMQFFYPMPDYKTPMTIYSDDYLPQRGDLTRVIQAYDYPKYQVVDMGEAYDEVCEAGVFDQQASSFLVFWSPTPQALKQEESRIFMKYNKTRSEVFQIRTTILKKQDGTGLEVEKSALTLDGTAHIDSFQEKYDALNMQNRQLQVAIPTFCPEKKAVRFPYLQGETWAQAIGEEFAHGKMPLEKIKEAVALIFDLEEDTWSDFTVSDLFLEAFGSDLTKEQLQVLSQDKTCKASNIDALFENIMLTKEGMFCIDYEWVFLCPVPKHYVLYRILYYLFEQFSSFIKDYDLREFLLEFEITSSMTLIYRQMEMNFQQYVSGQNQEKYLGKYLIDVKNLDSWHQLEEDFKETRQNFWDAKACIKDRDTTIRKITEVQRLTNNHVVNLESMMGDLRHEIDEMAKTLTYLNKHEAIIFKLKRKLANKFNQKYPKGSLPRKKLAYRKEYIFHPIRSMKLYSTEEGKNLRKGDFYIGEIYRQYGKLKFEQVEKPKVSIIIPVYNQVHYTYACLVSILEHTKDVTYEVIIADDVSTDATKHLAEFTQGLVICRNTTNQGFLRNCNNAARNARGEYVMFLNNDTKVTSGWLSSLVDLVESDETIGMVGSKLVYPDGRLQEAGGIIWSDGSGWNYGRLDDPEKPEYNYVKDVDYISGAAILLSNELWKQIGGFDTRFAPAYCEDSDLAFEVRKVGYRVVYQPKSKVIHFEGISNGTDVEGSGLKRYQVVNSKKLKEKWADEFVKQSENTGNPDPFLARERSQGKKVILVVDHYVPTYDRDAGSKTTFQYLKMFIKKGYVVKFLGDNFGHEEPYTTALEQLGIEVLYGADYQVKIWDWLKDHQNDIAVAYLNRPHIASKYIDYIKDQTNIKIVYYGHDLHFLREGREYELTGEKQKLEDAQYWKSIELSLMKKADMSYYPSYIERDAIKAIDDTIAVKNITAYVFDTFLNELQEDFSKREGLLFVGGFAHPPNADAVLWFARDIYPKIRALMGEVAPDFYIVGSKVTEEIKALEQPGSGIIVKGFVSDEELARLYGTCKVVVVPLRYGAGVKGKVVEAIYYGAPIVTTTIGAEGMIGSEELLLVEDDAEVFAQTVVTLYEDDGECQRRLQQSQTYIKEYFSMDGAWSEIAEDF